MLFKKYMGNSICMKKLAFILLCLFAPISLFAKSDKSSVLLVNGLLVPAGLFAENGKGAALKKNEITLLGFPPAHFSDLKNGYGRIGIEYKRLFVNNHIGVSGGIVWMKDEQRSVVFPVNVSFIPFANFILRPYIFCGGSFAYNFRDDVEWDSNDSPIFDKGADVCFNFGVGLSIGYVSWPVAVGFRASFYTDFGKGEGVLYHPSITVDYRF